MATKPKTPLVFDQAKLQGMQEPLTVRVEKIKGNSPTPLSLPSKDGQPSGAGWSRDEILGLEEWLLTVWSGGGLYRISITDANSVTMKWEAAFDPRTYPEIHPPTYESAAAPQQQASAAQHQAAQPQPQPQPRPQPHAAAAPPFGRWPPPAAAFISSFPQPRTAAQPSSPPPPPAQSQGPWNNPQGPQGPWGPQQWRQPQMQPQPAFLGYDPRTGQQMWGPSPIAPQQPQVTPLRGFGDRTPRRDRTDRYTEDRRRDEEQRRGRERDAERKRDDERITREREAERKRHDQELRERDERLRQMELLQKEAGHSAAVERQQQQYEQQMGALKEEIRRLGEGSKNKEVDEVRVAREAQARGERERERDQISAQFRALQDTITKVAERPTEDPKLRIMEQQIQQQRTDAEMRAREHKEQLSQQQAQAESRTRDHTEQVRRTDDQRQRDLEKMQWEKSQENLQQQLAAQEHRTKAMLQEATMNRPDPIVEFMKENARLSQDQARIQSENMREAARMQQASADRMSSMMMTPQALASLMRDNNSGADMMLKNVVGGMSGVFDVFRGAVEQITQLTGGAPEPPAARIIEQGVARAGELADRYLSVKREEVISEARVKAAQAQADATVKAAAVQAQVQAQAQAQARQATQQQAAARMAQQAPPQTAARKPSNGANGATAQGGLNGAAQPPVQAVAQPTAQRNKQAAAIDDGMQDPKTGQTIANVVPIQRDKRLGHTDEEWFGPALESVNRLRSGVKHFLDNLALETPEVGDDGEPAGLNPDKAVDAILKGINYVSIHKIAVKSFDELFKQGMFPDFVDICLPNTPQPYRDDCVKILVDEVEVNIMPEPPADVLNITPDPQPQQ